MTSPLSASYDALTSAHVTPTCNNVAIWSNAQCQSHDVPHARRAPSTASPTHRIRLGDLEKAPFCQPTRHSTWL